MLRIALGRTTGGKTYTAAWEAALKPPVLAWGRLRTLKIESRGRVYTYEQFNSISQWHAKNPKGRASIIRGGFARPWLEYAIRLSEAGWLGAAVLDELHVAATEEGVGPLVDQVCRLQSHWEMDWTFCTHTLVNLPTGLRTTILSTADELRIHQMLAPYELQQLDRQFAEPAMRNQASFPPWAKRMKLLSQVARDARMCHSYIRVRQFEGRIDFVACDHLK